LPDYIKHRALSFRHAFDGIAAAYRNEPNLRIHSLASVAVVALAAWLGLKAGDWTALFIVIGLVWCAELFNTAVEAVVDLASPQFHAKAKLAKDTSAAAVLLAAVTAALVGLLILGPPLYARLISLFK
jgi:diacylglycerol kinase